MKYLLKHPKNVESNLSGPKGLSKNVSVTARKISLVIILASLLTSSCFGGILCKKTVIKKFDCPVPEKTYYPKTANECFKKPCIIRVYLKEGPEENKDVKPKE